MTKQNKTRNMTNYMQLMTLIIPSKPLDLMTTPAKLLKLESIPKPQLKLSTPTKHSKSECTALQRVNIHSKRSTCSARPHLCNMFQGGFSPTFLCFTSSFAARWDGKRCFVAALKQSNLLSLLTFSVIDHSHCEAVVVIKLYLCLLDGIAVMK